MASNIDDTKPTAGAATTASVRTQFTTAKAEITALQDAVTSAAAAAGAAQSTANAAETHAQTGITNAATAQAAAGTAQSTANAAEPSSNKSTNSALGTSDTLFPTQAAVKTYVDTSVASAIDDRGNFDASSNTWPASGGRGDAGAILKGDFWYISVAGSLGGVAVSIGDNIRAGINTPGQTANNWRVLEANIGYVPENTNNKSTDTALGASDTLFPTQKAAKAYADARQAAAEATAAAGLAAAAVTTNINAQTGTTYTFAAADATYDSHPGKLCTFGNAAATTATIPQNSSVPIPVGARIDCIQDGAGKVTFGGTGVTINSQGNNKSIAGQFAAASLIKEATDTWYLIGSLVT